ncbi:hypothetical protein PRIC1_012365 [Phytophthora ramorum]
MLCLGIGKSIFYGYFFEHYKSTHPNTTIIAASFTKKSVMKKVVVFREDGTVEESYEGYAFIQAEHDAASERKADVLYLYDDPPQFEPNLPSKMVCFASPNKNWLGTVSKKHEARTLYMPVWDVQELVAAASYLQLGRLDPPVTCKMIEGRLGKFGGVARCCLAPDEVFVKTRTQELTADITGTDTIDVVKRMAKEIPGKPKHHRMCHLMPPRGIRRPNCVEICLLEKISSYKFEERDALLSNLQGIPKAGAYRGHLFEMKAHELLERGGDIETECISHDHPVKKTFRCDPSGEFYFFNSNDLSGAILKTGPYHIPRAVNFESIDSFYYPHAGDDKILLLFQMTVAPKHPVNGKGLVDILKQLGLLEKALTHPESVALIFVRPADSATSITGKQVIPWASAADSESVDIIPNIGGKKMEALAKVHIKTVGRGLREAVGGQSKNCSNAAY